MENGEKAIMIGVGIFITIIIISVVLLIVNMGVSVTNEGSKQIEGISTTVRKELFRSQFPSTVKYEKVKEAFNQYADQLLIGVDTVGPVEKVYSSNTPVNINKINSDAGFVAFFSGGDYSYYLTGDLTNAVYVTDTNTNQKRFYMYAAGTTGCRYNTPGAEELYNKAILYKRYFIYAKADTSSDIIGIYFKATSDL